MQPLKSKCIFHRITVILNRNTSRRIILEVNYGILGFPLKLSKKKNHTYYFYGKGTQVTNNQLENKSFMLFFFFFVFAPGELSGQPELKMFSSELKLETSLFLRQPPHNKFSCVWLDFIVDDILSENECFKLM